MSTSPAFTRSADLAATTDPRDGSGRRGDPGGTGVLGEIPVSTTHTHPVDWGRMSP
ncbi:hypothetical protein [uncultured Actinomyces sp.]|uniref:hypothetical protein n=1 Tax=uncultured Actinomyces sp. TaxID=249061 RepID=UPI0028D5EE35|nr:hypothetical protein [uncultured Actinomyces sp.]